MLSDGGRTINMVAGDYGVRVTGRGPHTIIAGSGNDTIYGGNGPTMIIGGSGADQIFCGNGPDTIQGGSGPDTIYGGERRGAPPRCGRRPDPARGRSEEYRQRGRRARPP